MQFQKPIWLSHDHSQLEELNRALNCIHSEEQKNVDPKIAVSLLVQQYINARVSLYEIKVVVVIAKT